MVHFSAAAVVLHCPALYTIGAYREAKQLGLWYIELLLLRMFEYEGEYVSRLRGARLPGATEPVPWSNEDNPDEDDAQ